MQFAELSQAFLKLEKTSSRNEITRILAELFKKALPKEIAKICYLSLGELLPAYRGIEFNIAEKMLIQILAKAYNMTPEKVASYYKKIGDLGDVAYEFSKAKSKVQKSKLSVEEVYDQLLEIAQESGPGSQERKINKMAELLRKLDSLSAKFVTRIPEGKLRLGFSDATILDALSLMIKGDKSARMEIEQAYNVTADIGQISQLIKRAGLEKISALGPKPGIPIRPSLAERIPDPEEIIKKLGQKVAIEPKLDGFRIAIHIFQKENKKEVMLFSRNLENTTQMFPEIVEAAKKLEIKSAILDGEAIGYDPKTGKFSPFQETVQRKRKYDIERMAKKIPLVVFVFDILYLDGTSLLKESFQKRRLLLEKILKNSSEALRIVRQKIAQSAQEIQEELEKAVREGLEGIVVKNLQSPYEAGSRGFHWVKFKPTSAALKQIREGTKTGLADTIDCLVMGAYKGKGKRADFGVGGFLLGVKGDDGKYYTISRLGSGLSDEDFKEMSKRIKMLQVKDVPKEYVVKKETVPDIWIKPSFVVEILADEITLSPRHTAGLKNDRGYSLRFPRLVRFREDKNPEDATTVTEVAKMYRMQHKLA